MIERVLRSIDGKGYKAYKELLHKEETIDGITVCITRVQGDPFAPPSVVEVKTSLSFHPEEPIPFTDLLHRKLFYLFPKFSLRGAGEGKSGIITLPRPSHIVIPRSAVEIKKNSLTVRFWVGLPSRRRRVLGEVARELLLERVPSLVREALRRMSNRELQERMSLWRDQEFIRKWLREKKYVGFVAEGSILPRACGGCEEPLRDAVPFEVPQRYSEEVELPSGKVLKGLVLRRLNHIVGPAFHGKTTLLEAIYNGVWNHVPGDGREYVITEEKSFYIESENGRWVSCVDLRAFLRSLPGEKDISCFSTRDASGSTSIASSLQEAVEIGVRHILVDEDSTATNFIHHDPLVEEYTGKKTLVPLTEVAPSLKKETSLTMVASGTSYLFSVDEEIIVMDEFRARDGEALRKYATPFEGAPYVPPTPRRIEKVPRITKWKLRGRTLEIRNVGSVDLAPNKQLRECSQYYTASLYAVSLARRGTTAKEVKKLSDELKAWKYVGIRYPPPNLAYVRPVDIWFILNRIPGIVFAPR